MAMTQLEAMKWLIYYTEHVSAEGGGINPAVAELEAWFLALPKENSEALISLANKYRIPQLDAVIARATAEKTVLTE